LTLKNIAVVGGSDISILKNINFSIQGPGMVGVVGESGAGKSTFIHLLACFTKPVSGDFQVDGKAIQTIQDSWSKNIAYIPQHPYIFPASLADNIRFYTPDA